MVSMRLRVMGSEDEGEGEGDDEGDDEDGS
jgi:hypothetical protein